MDCKLKLSQNKHFHSQVYLSEYFIKAIEKVMKQLITEIFFLKLWVIIFIKWIIKLYTI